MPKITFGWQRRFRRRDTGKVCLIDIRSTQSAMRTCTSTSCSWRHVRGAFGMLLFFVNRPSSPSYAISYTSISTMSFTSLIVFSFSALSFILLCPLFHIYILCYLLSFVFVICNEKSMLHEVVDRLKPGYAPPAGVGNGPGGPLRRLVVNFLTR